jgi:hypothetical protein
VEYCAPRLRIATVTMQFASRVGKFYNCDQTLEGEESSLSSPVDGGSVSSSSSSISTSQKLHDVEKKKQPIVVVLLILFLNSSICLNMISPYSIRLVLIKLTRSIHFCRNW